MVYYVLELQTNETGGANIFVFTDRNQAEQKYHQVLTYASVSEVRKHGAVLMNEDGFILKSETYNHSTINDDDWPENDNVI